MVVWDQGITIPLSFFDEAEKSVHLLLSVNFFKQQLNEKEAEKDRKRKPKSSLTEEEKKQLKKEKKKFKKDLKQLVNLERAVMRVLIRTVRNSVWPGYTGRTLCALPQGCPRAPFHNERIKIAGGELLLSLFFFNFSTCLAPNEDHVLLMRTFEMIFRIYSVPPLHDC